MSFTLTEFIIEGIINQGLVDIKTDIDMKLEDIFATLLHSYLSDKYGQDEIDKIKLVLNRVPISVTQSLSQLSKEGSLPAFSIHLQSDNEKDDLAALDDLANEKESYTDPDTSEEREFLLKYIPSQETIMIGIHTENAIMTKYLYHILRYILFNSKTTLEEMGIKLSRHVGSDFSLKQGLLGDQAYSRYVTFQATHYDSWKTGELGDEIETILPFPVTYEGGEEYTQNDYDVITYSYSTTMNPITYDADTGIMEVPYLDFDKVVEGYYIDIEGQSTFYSINSISEQDGTITIDSGLDITSPLGNGEQIRAIDLKMIRAADIVTDD